MRKAHRGLAALLRASTAICVMVAMLSGCADTVSRLQQVGKPPPYTPVTDVTTKPGYQPISTPITNIPQPQQYANDLWQPGARAFFRDQRASRAGDILKVVVRINDQVTSQNQSEGKRQSTDVSSFSALGGVQKKVAHIFSGGGDPSNFLNTSGDRDTKSTGNITRQDQIQTEVSAIVTQVLPNGNMVIDGSQETLMNYEIRTIGVKGIVRPQDISPDNVVDVSQVADARITYSGRGQLMDMQQPRWGSQVVDILSPF